MSISKVCKWYMIHLGLRNKSVRFFCKFSMKRVHYCFISESMPKGRGREERSEWVLKSNRKNIIYKARLIPRTSHLLDIYSWQVPGYSLRFQHIILCQNKMELTKYYTHRIFYASVLWWEVFVWCASGYNHYWHFYGISRTSEDLIEPYIQHANNVPAFNLGIRNY